MVIIMEPTYISGKSAWVENIPFIFELIKEQKPSIIVELGIHYGDSYFAFCQAVKENGYSTKCYGVDLFEGDDLTGYYDDSVLNQVKKHNDDNYKEFSTILHCYFDLALPYFKDVSIDMLHIDGSHYYMDVKHDFYAWLPKVKVGGIILLHDINVVKERYGVWKLWKELKEQKHGFKYKEINNQYGLGILYV
jgi:hypothetical protein